MATVMLTKKQLKVLDYIKIYYKKDRVPPTVREIAKHMGCVHSNVHRMLRLLERDNHIKVHPCLLYTSPSPRDGLLSRMPSSA